MSVDEMYFYSFQINRIAKFGFNYGRRMNQKQLRKIEFIEYTDDYELKNTVNNLLPKKDIDFQAKDITLRFINKPLTSFFELMKGSGGYKESFEDGRTPLISATSYNNGVTGYVNASPKFTKKTITVERISGNAFVQVEDYVTVPDDITVLIPKEDLPLSFLFMIATLIKLQSWKYCYGRKLSKSRLKLIEIPVPFADDEIDFEVIDYITEKTYGWESISELLK